MRGLRAHRPDWAGLRLSPLSRPATGLSSETLFAEAAWSTGSGPATAELVMRLPPAGEGLFPTYDLRAQAEVQDRLASTSVPVARPIAFEPDPAWVGAPFILMPRVAGRVLATQPPFLKAGWLREAGEEDQAALHRSFTDVLGDIHRLDWQALELGFLSRPGGTDIEAEIDWWADYLDWASDGHPLPVLADALAWCRETRPEQLPGSCLLWGDVQFANAVFGEDLRPAAVLDWEMASIGPAELDLGWFLALHRMTVDTCGSDLPGFPGRSATVAAWERRVGRPAVELEWFETFAVLRSGAILVRVARLLAADGVDDSWLTRGAPQLELLRAVLEGGSHQNTRSNRA